MAKVKKRPTTFEMRMRRHHDIVIKNTINKMVYSGSSTTRGVNVEGFDYLNQHIKNKTTRMQLEVIISDILRQRPQQWNVWWVVFFEGSSGNRWVHSDIHRISNITVREFDVTLQAYLQQLMDDYIGVYGQRTVKGYGWVATHGDIEEIYAREEDIIEQLVQYDVYNVKRAHELMLEAKIRNGEKKGLDEEKLNELRQALIALESGVIE